LQRLKDHVAIKPEDIVVLDLATKRFLVDSPAVISTKTLTAKMINVTALSKRGNNFDICAFAIEQKVSPTFNKSATEITSRKTNN
jgi:hypothetical protein